MLVLPMSKKPVKTATSKLTTKYQATIPEPVRKILHLGSGDVIAFDIEDDGIHVRKARPTDLLFAKALEGTMSEWESVADEESYRDL
jgi:antitoxin PrlF